MKAATTRKKPVTKRRKATAKSGSYNRVKEFEGRQYTGVQVGRGHHWHYDQGDWKETKITPDLWEISYKVMKRRTGKAPEGSGVPVGTAYHWYILAHQSAVKENANDYMTTMTGLKFKIAHKRADKAKWSTSGATQRKHLIAFLKQFIAQLESSVIPLQLEVKGVKYKGEAVPIADTCTKGVCYQAEVMLNDESLGIIRCAKSGWKMDLVKDQQLIDAIGNEIMLWFE
ncbi:hypothetical protein SAMN05444266_104402 [Chitinophaga jiangningensis]|uniref:Uncharacterized protein n=1 Tax=Chitinophaga jiangningensis TaxID=1419482 RepID=A0A1M7CN49_9BACT|nr:hypothetical protein [Chitinophaga jiangningensis]SHL68691.1 hypothetical protein SAMN05444266_104402 [Chitinophaga jiangningensis]